MNRGLSILLLHTILITIRQTIKLNLLCEQPVAGRQRSALHQWVGLRLGHDRRSHCRHESGFYVLRRETKADNAWQGLILAQGCYGSGQYAADGRCVSFARRDGLDRALWIMSYLNKAAKPTKPVVGSILDILLSIEVHIPDTLLRCS